MEFFEKRGEDLRVWRLLLFFHISQAGIVLLFFAWPQIGQVVI
jgi:hypothetical protein